MSYTHVYIEIKDVGMIFAYTHKYITYHFLIIYYITFTHIHIRIYIYLSIYLYIYILYNHIHIFSFIYIHILWPWRWDALARYSWQQDWGVAKPKQCMLEKLGVANFWKLPTFPFFQENMVSISGRFQTHIACHCMINKCVSSGECFFTYPGIFNWGLCCLCVPFFDPSWKQCRSRSKIPGYVKKHSPEETLLIMQWHAICVWKLPEISFFWKSGPEASRSPLWYKGSRGRSCSQGQGSFLVELVWSK